MSQLSLLLRTASMRAVRQPGLRQSKLAALGLLLLGALFLVLVGLAILPAHMPRGSEDNPGGTVLELTFWLTCLLSAVQSFRVMESLFRTGDARIVAPLPLDTTSLFFYRLLRGLFEVALFSVLGAALLLPIVWRGDVGLYGVCVGLWAGGLLITLCVGFGVQLYAGVASLQGEAQFDMHGPSGFILAPGIALAISVLLILFAKLTAEEFLKGAYGPARSGLLIVGVPSVICLTVGWRYFTRHFYAIFASFLEADLFVLDIGYPYFREGRRPKTRIERALPDAVVPLFRKDRLQYRRRHTLSRIVVWLAAAGLAAMLLWRGSDAIPIPLLVALPLILVLGIANPWGRLSSTDLEPGMGLTLPLPTAFHLQAKRAVALLETLLLSAPVALAVAIGVGVNERGWRYGLATAAIAFLLAACAHPLLAGLAERGGGWRTLLGAAIILGAATGVASWSVFIVFPLALTLLAAGKLFAGPSSPSGSPS